MLTGRPVSGDFFETLASFVAEYDNAPLQLQVTQNTATGALTVGYDYSLLTSTKTKTGKTVYTINPHLVADFNGIHKFSSAEIALLKKIAADLTNGKLFAATRAFSHRTSSLLSFTLTSGKPNDQAEKLFGEVLNRDKTSAHLFPIANNPEMKGTYELLSLETLAFESPSLVTSAIRKAVTAGQRAVAWFDILTTLDKGKGKTPQRLATETLRITEAGEFGLYSGGALTSSVSEAESVYRFLVAHEAALKKDLAATGESSTEISYVVSGAFSPADYELVSTYGGGVYIYSTNVILAKSDKGGTIQFGKNLAVPFDGGSFGGGAYNALVVGGKGDDRLVISGNLDKTLGYGQTIIFASGGGVDTVNESGLTSYETLEIAAGPGKVDVIMPKGGLEFLKIEDPGSFKGKITGFVSGEVIDLVGIGTATKATLAKNGELTVTGGSTTASILLGGAASYARYKFAVQSDSAGGTEITVVPRTSHVITFSEYAIGTIITNQYQEDGVVFSADPVKNKKTGKTTYSPCEIYSDSADLTSPALANFAHGSYSGPIIGHFVDPNTGAKGTVTQFSFDAGYFNNVGSTEVEWFNAKHKLIGSERETTLGYDHFNIASSVGIASFEVISTGKELSGFSFDNLVVGHVIG